MYLEELIGYPIEEYEVFIKKDNIVLTNFTKVAELCGVTRRTIYNWVKNRKEDKFVAFGIEMILAKKLANYYICSDGEIRSSSKTVIKKIGNQKNLVRLTIKEKRMTLRAANLVFKSFVNKKHDVFKDKLLFLDGNLENCSLDNLQDHQDNA